MLFRSHWHRFRSERAWCWRRIWEWSRVVLMGQRCRKQVREVCTLFSRIYTNIQTYPPHIRPMSISITNATRGTIRNFRVIQPQFWASLVWVSVCHCDNHKTDRLRYIIPYVQNSSDILLQNFYVNATNFDTSASGTNWVQNTDGSDTYQSSHVTYENWVYQGGDDCIALKANSTQIVVKNVTCLGGTGIAFGSIGQYPGVLDIIQDVLIEDVLVS